MDYARKNKRTILMTAALLFVIGGGGAYWAMRPDPEVERYKELNKMVRNRDSDLSREEREEAWRELRELSENLTDEQRQVLQDESRKRWEEREIEQEKRAIAKAEEYFKLTPAERVKHLDELVDRAVADHKRMEERAKQMEARREEWQRNNPGQTPPTRGGGGWGRGSGEGRSRGEGRPQGEGQTGEGGERPQRVSTRFRPNDEQREMMRSKMLDVTTAEQRAMRTEYLRDLDAARIERGLPSLKDMPRRGFGRGGPGGFGGGGRR